jgi:hypothetical protein
MAGSRLFGGGYDSLEFTALWNAAPSAAITVAVVVKPTAVSGMQTLVQWLPDNEMVIGVSGSSMFLYSSYLGGDITAASGLRVTAGDWQLLAITKPAGTRPVKFHRIPLDGTRPAHEFAIGSPTPTLQDVHQGNWRFGSFSFDDELGFVGQMAAAAVWNRDVTEDPDDPGVFDDTVLNGVTSWRGIIGLAPRAAWRFDGSVRADFDDQTGRNNDLAATVGTSHDTSAPTNFWPVATTGSSYRGFGSGAWPTAAWVPFSSTSVWNTPIDPLVDAVHPDSATLVSTVLGLSLNETLPVGHLVAGRADTGTDYAHPLYFARTDDPLFTLDLPSGHPLDGARIRIPDDALPASGGDAHLSVVQPTAESGVWYVYDFWDVTSKPRGGGTLVATGASKRDVEGSGLNAGATAAHFALAAGVIRGSELVAGQINHALFCTVQYGAAENDLSFGNGVQRGLDGEGSFVYPAEHGDSFPLGRAPTTVPPMGARFWFDMAPASIDLLSIPDWKKTILKALNRYGAYFGDTGGPGFGFQFESGQSYTSFGVADPIVSYAADNGVTQYENDYVFNLSSGVRWADYLKIVLPPRR